MAEVPFITAWSSEQHFWAGKLPDGTPAIMQRESQGKGVPMFSFRHFVRLRRLFQERLCSICGDALDASAVMFPLGEWRDHLFVFNDTPLHGSCADLALALCPHLKSMNAIAIPMPERMESRILWSEFEGQMLSDGYAYVMDEIAFRRWRNG